MATKRHSKTWEQQAKYYEVDNIADYMIETYLNGNISTYRQLYYELRPAARRLFISWLFHTELNRATWVVRCFLIFAKSAISFR